MIGFGGDDHRSARLIEEYLIHFVYQSEEGGTLHFLGRVINRSVAQEVEAEGAVTYVSDVTVIACSLLLGSLLLGHAAHRHAETLEDWTHPFGVSLGQGLVHGDEMCAFPG